MNTKYILVAGIFYRVVGGLTQQIASVSNAEVILAASDKKCLKVTQ